MGCLVVSAGQLAARIGWVVAVALVLGGVGQAQEPGAVGPYQLDTDRLQFAQVEDDAPLRSEGQNRSEYEAYNEVLLHVRDLPLEGLEQHAYRDVTFRDLVRPVRQDYQFKLLYFRGRLASLRRGVPNKRMEAAGVTDWYEGWMFPEGGSDPMCVHITELPPGLEPNPRYRQRPRVVVAGYSFKLIHYESSQKLEDDPSRNKVRRAPLLLARSFRVLPEAVEPDAWRTGFLPGMLGVMALILAVVVALTLVFRRGDRATRQAIEQRRERNPFEGEPGPPG